MTENLTTGEEYFTEFKKFSKYDRISRENLRSDAYNNLAYPEFVRFMNLCFDLLIRENS
jgi:hypothetical protein